jgi:excisionase family DNA binding protein
VIGVQIGLDVLTVKQVASELGLSTNTVYEAIRRKEIPSVKIGRKIFVSRQALERMLLVAAG